MISIYCKSSNCRYAAKIWFGKRRGNVGNCRQRKGNNHLFREQLQGFNKSEVLPVFSIKRKFMNKSCCGYE